MSRIFVSREESEADVVKAIFELAVHSKVVFEEGLAVTISSKYSH